MNVSLVEQRDNCWKMMMEEEEREEEEQEEEEGLTPAGRDGAVMEG